MKTVGTKYETSQRAVELAEANESIFAAIGMHPIHIKTDLLKLKMDDEEGAFAPLGEEFDAEKYKKLALSGSRRGRRFYIKRKRERLSGGSIGIIQARMERIWIHESAADVHGELEFPRKRLDDAGGGDFIAI